jgi:hypothetical protein
MYDFQSDLTLIKAIETRHELLDIRSPIQTVNDLLSQRILMVVIDREIRAQAIPNKRVQVLKDDLDTILPALHQHLLRDKHQVVLITHLLGLQGTAIDHDELHAAPIVIHRKVLFVHVGQALQPEGDIDDTLVRISLHQTQDESVVDIPQVLIVLDTSTSHSLPAGIFN